MVEDLDKSQGRQEDQSPGVDTAAETHAALRHTDGFDIIEMVSEYRALRASSASCGRRHIRYDRRGHDDFGRFNEAIDQALAASVVRFTQNIWQGEGYALGVPGHAIRGAVGAIQMVAELVPRVGMNHEQSRLLQEA